APQRVPNTIADLHEDPAALSSIPVDDALGISSGIGTGTGLPGVLLDALSAPPAPPRIEPQAPVRPASPPPPPKPSAVSSGVQPARLIRQIQPVYPPLAISARIQGTVRLVAIIGRDGAIENLQVASGHPLLVPAAVAAVKQWLYRPTLLNNEP